MNCGPFENFEDYGGHWQYWYLASPHMKDICKSLNELEDKYKSEFHIISVTMNHQNYIVLYRYWEEVKDESNNSDHSNDTTDIHSSSAGADSCKSE